MNDAIYLRQATCSFADALFGTVDWAIAALLPPCSPKKARVWNLEISGAIQNRLNAPTIFLVFDFSAVPFQYKQNISFEGIVQGIINYGNCVSENVRKRFIQKIPGYLIDYQTETMTLCIEGAAVTPRARNFLMVLYINDSASVTSLSLSIPNYIETYRLVNIGCPYFEFSYDGLGSLNVFANCSGQVSDLSGYTLTISVGNVQTVEGNTNLLDITFHNFTGVLQNLVLKGLNLNSGALLALSNFPALNLQNGTFKFSYAYDVSESMWAWYLQNLVMSVLIDTSGFVEPCPFSDTYPAFPYSGICEPDTDSIHNNVMYVNQWYWHFTKGNSTNLYQTFECTACLNAETEHLEAIEIYVQNRTPAQLNESYSLTLYLESCESYQILFCSTRT